MKKLMPENKEYWIKKGYSINEAEAQALLHKGARYPGNPNYYLTRNKASTHEEASELARVWKESKCSLSKKYLINNKFNGDVDAYTKWKSDSSSLNKNKMLERMTLEEYTAFKQKSGNHLIGKRPTDVEYWINRGYSKTEAYKQIKLHAINSSPRRIEYWINRGHTVEDAIKSVSKFQNKTSLESFITRYGHIDGLIRYNEWVYGQTIGSRFSYLYWLECGYSENDAKVMVSNIQSEYGKLSPKCTEYWTNRGYDKSTAEMMACSVSRKSSLWCIEYWIDRGYSIEDAKLEISKIQKDNSKRGLSSYKHSGKQSSSKLENSVSLYFLKRGHIVETDCVITDGDNMKMYFPDMLIDDNFYIEVYGDFWHGNPKIYNEHKPIIGGITCSEKQKSDSYRKLRIEAITKKQVIVWWESDIVEMGLDTLYNNLKMEIDL